MSAAAPRFEPTGPLPRGRTLLEASAGTGKTFTITSLVLRLVAEERVPLERLLVVTFTRAATAELRERVRARITAAAAALEQALADPDAAADTGDVVVDHLLEGARSAGGDELARRYQALCRARENFDDATISTIHGFCQQALAQAGLDADVDLDAELTEDLTELLEEIVDDFLVRELRGGDDAFYDYLRGHKVTRSDLLRLARAIEAEPDLRLHPDLDLEVAADERWQERVRRCREVWRHGRDDVEAWITAMRDEGAFGSGTKYSASRLETSLTAIDEWCGRAVPGLGDLEDISKHLTYVTPGAVRAKLTGRADLPTPPPAVEEVESLLGRAVSEPATALRLRFAQHVRDEVERRKRGLNLLSFADLLRALHRALSDGDTRRSLVATIRARFEVALVDEFQDTDPVQWAVFDAVFPPGDRLVLIGDPKQAIYAFRGADIDTYRRAAATADERFTLPTNWRSDQRYLDALGGLLDRPDAFGAEHIDFVEVAAPKHHRDDRLLFPRGPQPTLELRQVPRALAADPDQDPPALIPKWWADGRLPRHVADDIVDFLASGARLERDGVLRGVEPADVAVLTRTNRQARMVERALHDAGVPAVVGSDQSVFATLEATSLQRLLDAMLSSGAEVQARAALATPLLGVDAHDLAALEDVGWDHWLDLLEGWSATWRRNGVAAMLRTVLAATDAPGRLVGQPGGERALTNLRHLAELLHAAEGAHRFGPQGLAGWLREQRHAERPDADDLELRLESDAEAVQILTVHRAKGLQYPVVWCPWLWEGRLLADGEERTLRLHDPDDRELALDLDLAVEVEPKRGRIAAAKRERWEESLRLLYVALTRAEHRCVVYTGAFKDSGTSPLAHLLHDRGFSTSPTGDVVVPGDPSDVDDETLLEQLRARADDVIGVDVLGPLRERRAPVADGGPEGTLSVRTFDRPVDRAWQRTSFSRLVRDRDDVEPGSPVAEGRDHDQGVDDLAEDPADLGTAPVVGGSPGTAAARAGHADDAPVPLATFPRGADAGTFLHQVLEHLDFTQADVPGVIEQVVDEQLRATGLHGVDRDAVHHGLRAALATPLGALTGDRALDRIDPADRLDELDFDLPLAGGYAADRPALTIVAIAEVLADHAGGDPVLARAAARLRARPAPPVRGFLTGSIDLVCRVDGRYLVADYKSNWLGERADRGTGAAERCVASHYHPARLAEAMVGHDYLLQGHLYLVALHRYLAWRLSGTYDYDRHVGGMAYLFLRGMIGPATPRDEGGTPYGVYVSRPSKALVEDLDAVLRGTR